MHRPLGHALALILCWAVTALPGRVIDGDTFDVSASIWLSLAAVERVRLLGVDAPELKTATLEAGLAAKQFTEHWLAQGPIHLTACKRDSFGRLLAKVQNEQGEDLAEALIKAGLGISR